MEKRKDAFKEVCNPMGIVLKRDAREALEKMKDEIKALVIDGSLDKEYVKTCGCCGPPPSPDYDVKVIGSNDPDGMIDPSQMVKVNKIVDIWIDKQLYDAAEAASMNFVLFFIETANQEGNEYFVAKII